MSSRRIVALNNSGVRSLHGGHFDEAIHCLRHALECLKSYTTDVDANISWTSSSSYRVSHTVTLEADVIPLRSPLPTSILDPTQIMAISPHNMFDMYRTAFFLPRLEFLTKNNIADVSVVVIYNLALSHHLTALTPTRHGQQEGTSTVAHLMQAHRYYKLAMTVFRTQEEENDRNDNSSSRTTMFQDGLVLFLGLLTNLGHVFAHFCQAAEATVCLQMMQDLLLDDAMACHLTAAEEAFFCAAVTHCAASQACGVMAAAA